MGHEVLQLVKSMNWNKLELQLALQCSPLLMGIKVSNILIVNRSEAKQVLYLFRNTAISCYILCQSENRVAFLLYQKEELIRYLNTPKVSALLAEMGYRQMDLQQIFRKVAIRYRSYMRAKEKKSDFPHELATIG